MRHQRLFHDEQAYALVHAGLLPDWPVSKAVELAHEVETALRRDDYPFIFSQLYGNDPSYWDDKWSGAVRLRVIVNAMTRMRICSRDGYMNFSYKGAIDKIPDGFLPWFAVDRRASRNHTVVCGHWSALGLHVTDNVIALDSGCVWNGQLTAIRLEDRKVFQIRCDMQAAKDSG